MNFDAFIEKNINKIQKKEITNITKHKIDYISDYVYNWGIVASNFKKCCQINFIDCMCNAGIYKDKTLGTSMRVLKIFMELSKIHPGKTFNLFLNDNDKNKIEVITELSHLINKDRLENVHIFISNEDVNAYLKTFDSKFSKNMSNSLSLLFVDPYNFGTVKIKNIKEFLTNHYSELLFNYFCSDYRRNSNNPNALSKQDEINNSMEGVSGYNQSMNYTEVLELIRTYLKTDKINYSFAYEFRTTTNVPFYNIIFLSPNKKGLEKIKESYWKVFEGAPFYLNDESQIKQEELLSKKDLFEEQHALDIRKNILSNYINKKISYKEIELFILEHTMLRVGQIIRSVIQPLINEKQIIKCNEVKNINNYKDDYYVVCGEKNE